MKLLLMLKFILLNLVHNEHIGAALSQHTTAIHFSKEYFNAVDAFHANK